MKQNLEKSYKRIAARAKSLSDIDFAKTVVRYRGSQKKRTTKNHLKKLVRKLHHARYGKGLHKKKLNKAELLELSRNYEKKESSVLKSLYSERDRNWKKYNKRAFCPEEIDFSNFSFIDNPADTLEHFHWLAKSESLSAYNSCKINFTDNTINDISPYLLFGSMKHSMFPFFSGGKMTQNLKQIMRYLHLDKFLQIDLKTINDEDRNIMALPLFYRKDEAGEEFDVNKVEARDIVSTKICDMFNSWLETLSKGEKVKFQLSDTGKSHFGDLIGEVLENAENHAKLNDSRCTGKWYTTCFMEYEKKTNNYKCCLSFFNEGVSIAQSISSSNVENVCIRLNDYQKKHKRYNKDLLATIFAIQDNSTRRLGDSQGGFGLMHMVDFIKKIGGNHDMEKQPQIVIISGNVYIKFVEKHLSSTSDIIGRRYQWFNEENSWDYPPDEKDTFNLKRHIAGTIITSRFYLDKEMLVNERI